MLIQERERSESRTSEGIKHTLPHGAAVQGRIQPEHPPKRALRSGCSGLASTPAGWKELREMVREGRREKGKQSAPCAPQNAALHCWGSQRAQQTSLPSLGPLTLFTFLQIVSTFCINNPGASEGEGSRGEGVGGNPMALLLWKKKVEDEEERLELQPWQTEQRVAIELAFRPGGRRVNKEEIIYNYRQSCCRG